MLVTALSVHSVTWSRKQSGKVLITLPDNAKVMTPIEVNDEENDLLLAVSQEGRMLLFPVGDLPQLSKGKGNKIISITSAAAAAGRRSGTSVCDPPGCQCDTAFR